MGDTMEENKSPQELVADLLRQAPRYPVGIGIIVWMPDGGVRFVPRPDYLEAGGGHEELEPTALRAQLERLMKKGGKPVGTLAMWNGLTGGRTLLQLYPEYCEDKETQNFAHHLIEVLLKGAAEAGVDAEGAEVVRLEGHGPCVQCGVPMSEEDLERELCDACLGKRIAG